METVQEYLPVLIYTGFFLGIKISERLVLSHPGNTIRKGWGDWTVYFILIPLWSVLAAPILEFIFLGNRPVLWEMIMGGLLFTASGFFSIRGYVDLQQGFTKAIGLEDTGLVVSGLFQTIRHPISLGTILFCIACPLFLAARPSWIPALVGILGVLFRISVEESFMQKHIPDYAEYKKRTWALIPYIY